MIVATSSCTTQPFRSLSKSWKASLILFLVSRYQVSSRGSPIVLVAGRGRCAARASLLVLLAGALDVCVRERGRLSGGSPLRCAPPDLEPLAAAAERTHPTPRSPRRARSHVYLRGRAGATRTVSDHNLSLMHCRSLPNKLWSSAGGQLRCRRRLLPIMTMRVLVLLLAHCAARPPQPRSLTLSGGAKKKAIKHGKSWPPRHRRDASSTA